MTHFTATKTALKAAADKLGLTLDPNTMVHRGGQDPGGWSQKGSLVCIIHEGTGIPNAGTNGDPLAWWIELGDEVGRLTGKPMFFEWVNSCVAVGYPA
jgi:hypothetical protein